MIIDNQSIHGSTNEFKKYTVDNISIYLNGLMWYRGKRAGRESIEALIQDYRETGGIPYVALFGAYLLVIQDGNTITVVPDNSNMHCIYYSQNGISNSCLELARFLKARGEALSINDIAFYEMFELGKIYGNRSFIQQISVLDYSNVIVVKDKRIQILKKNIGDISCQSSFTSLHDFLIEFSKAK